LRSSTIERSRTGRPRKTFRNSLLIILAVAVGIAFIPPARTLFLRGLGAALVSSEAPQKADAIAVLGGDYLGRRILAAARLAQQGYAPKVIVTGSARIYGNFESDLAIDFAVRHGFSRDLFVPVHKGAFSTVEEARALVIPMARSMGVHKLLVVTSEFHTGRSRRIYRREAQGIEIHTVAADTQAWDRGYWWTNREGRKIWLMEATKNVADWFRL
jgi:uncharacterized SAM-binding protein YcdF (DUF218 family)